MFHQIAVRDNKTTYLRFFWYRDNTPNQDIIEDMARVHLMGNTSSPAVANLAVRYAARKEPPKNGQEWIKEDALLSPYQSNRTREPDPVERSLTNGFYVDDLLNSDPTPQHALHLLEEGIARFTRYDFTLCKVQLNSDLIRNEYPSDEAGPTTMDLAPADLSSDNFSKGHSSLGLQWDLQQDSLNIKTEFKDRPMTKRGLLGHLMSPYDPFGIAAPAMLAPKLLQREIMPPSENDPHLYHALDWDDPLPKRLETQWNQMIQTCQKVQEIQIKRSFYPPNRGAPQHQQLFAFADASDLALCYVVYLRTVTSDRGVFISFVAGSTKVLPKGTSLKGQISIPRAELCAACDLAAKVLEIETELNIPSLEPTQYFTDSDDVLSWIQDTTHQLKMYVSSRRNFICKVSTPTAWHYIPTSVNPADI